MNELVTLISQRTGIPNDMAEEVVQIIDGYFKNRLPEPVSNQLSSALGIQSGGTTGQNTGTTSQSRGFLSRLFGGRSEEQHPQT